MEPTAIYMRVPVVPEKNCKIMGNMLSLERVVFPGHPNPGAKQELESQGFDVNTRGFAELHTTHKPVCNIAVAVYHGNMEDFSEVAHLWQKLNARKLIGFEYPGYGWRIDSAPPSQDSILREVKKLAPVLGLQRTVVCGRSLGTFAAIHMALELGSDSCAGLVLLSPMLTAVATKIMPPLHRALSFMDLIDNESAVKQLSARIPVLIVHGKNDMVVPVSNARFLRTLLPSCHYLELDDIGHNDLSNSEFVWDRIRAFVSICQSHPSQ